MKDIIIFTSVIILAILLIVLIPIISISAVNVLFDTNIDINFYTWLAAFWLHLIISKSYAYKK